MKSRPILIAVVLCAGLTGSGLARVEVPMKETRNILRIEQGNCLDLMAALPAGSVDLILCDPPYGITECRWDRKIPRAPFWRQCWRVLKERGVIALFAQQPFATELVAWSHRERAWDQAL
ncbi:MAG: hypothetical protein ACM3ZB_07140 [bacterium]